MVHTAVFDAVNGIEGGCEPYHVRHRAPPGAGADASAATAAHEVLRDLFPALRKELAAAYTEALASLRNGPAKYKGIAWGRHCGRKLLERRRDDGSDDLVLYVPSGELGRWQPTPPAFAPALLPNGRTSPPSLWTAATSSARPPPPAFDSPEYAAAYNEVLEYGDADSTARNADQTLVAYFWEDGPATATPPGHWHVIAQQLSERFGLGLAENARLFALLSMVQADAGDQRMGRQVRLRPRPALYGHHS